MAQKHTGDTDSKRSAVVKGEPAEARLSCTSAAPRRPATVMPTAPP